MKLTSGSGPRQRRTAALVAVLRSTSGASPGTTPGHPSVMSSLVTFGRFGGAAKRRPEGEPPPRHWHGSRLPRQDHNQRRPGKRVQDPACRRSAGVDRDIEHRHVVREAPCLKVNRNAVHEYWLPQVIG